MEIVTTKAAELQYAKTTNIFSLLKLMHHLNTLDVAIMIKQIIYLEIRLQQPSPYHQS